MEQCKVVAEIGASHIGSLERAKELAKLAKLSGAHYLKTQKRNPIESIPEHLRDKPHPNEIFSYGKTYFEHRQKLELNIDDHKELQEYCEQKLGIKYGVSVWDITSAEQVIEMNPSMIKIGSPCNQNWDLMNLIFKEYKGTGVQDIHVSLGMVTNEERQEIIEFILGSWLDYKRIVMYHCTSEYPCPFERLYLKEIAVLRESLPQPVSVGFSSHGYGIAADIAAYTLGATWIERHFIDDRMFRHTDARLSLEPGGLWRLCRDLKSTRKALAFKENMSDEEKKQRNKLKRR